MNKKEAFIEAVRILAPGDRAILKAATRVSEESLPTAPGGRALEFVVALQRMKGTAFPCRSRFKVGGGQTAGIALATEQPLDMPLEPALKVKGAEFWLKLGQPVQALIELDHVPKHLQEHPKLLKLRITAIGAIRESSELVV
jgi:hypothetical protein